MFRSKCEEVKLVMALLAARRMSRIGAIGFRTSKKRVQSFSSKRDLKFTSRFEQSIDFS